MTVKDRPVMTERIVERLQAHPDLWRVVETAQAIAELPHRHQQAAQWSVKVEPRIAALRGLKRDLEGWLDAAGDDLGPITVADPVTDAEREWFAELDRYEVVCLTIETATNIRHGVYRLP